MVDLDFSNTKKKGFWTTCNFDRVIDPLPPAVQMVPPKLGVTYHLHVGEAEVGGATNQSCYFSPSDAAV